VSRLCDPRAKPPLGATLDPEHPLSRGLVSCWLFNEGTGRLANNIGLVGGASVVQGGGRWQADQRGPALVLGEAQGHMVPDPKSIDPFLGENQDFALTFWWRVFPPHPEDTRHLLGNYATGESCFFFYTYAGRVRCWVRENWPEGSRAISAQWVNGTDGHWHHYTLTRRGTTIRLYQDGQLAVTDTDEHNALGLAPASQSLMLGRAPSGVLCPGAFNELRLYDRGLSDSEIAQLYREPYAGVQSDSTRRFYHIPRPERKHHVITVHRPDPRVKPPLGATLDPEHPLSRGLVGCWLFNEGMGNRISDLTNPNLSAVKAGSGSFSWEGDAFRTLPDETGSLAPPGSGPYFNFGNQQRHRGLTQKTIAVAVCNLQEDSWRWILTKGHSFTPGGWALGYHYAVKSWAHSIRNSEGNDRYNYFGPAPIGEWTHVVVTYDAALPSGNMRGYVNGKYSKSYSCPSVVLNPSSALMAFADEGSYPRPFNGLVKYIRFYNRALTDDEIAWLYAEPYAGIDYQPRRIFSAERYFPRRKQQLDGAPFGGEIR
jgi:hypothetical protein